MNTLDIREVSRKHSSVTTGVAGILLYSVPVDNLNYGSIDNVKCD